MGLDDRLGALGVAVADGSDVDPEASLAAVHGRARRRRQRRRLVGASIAAVVVLAVGGLALAVADRDDAQRVTTSPDDDAAPPPIDRSQPHLWLSAEQLPPEGGDLAVVIVDPTAMGDTWGLGATLDRWDGDGWTKVDDAMVCTGCVGQVGGSLAIRLLGLDADPTGPMTFIRTGSLERGWYRLAQTSNEGTVAAGRFEVRSGAPAVPPVGRDGGAHLEVQPAVLFESAALRAAEPVFPELAVSTSVPTDLSRQREIAVLATADTGPPPRAWQDGRTRLERWDGARWVDVAEVRSGGMSAGIGADDPVLLTLDDPPPGDYRVLVDTDEATIEGRFWVTHLD